jgi:histone H3/H4
MDAYDTRMEKMLVDVARKTVGRMVADKRVTVEARDLHTFNLAEEE